MIRKKIKHSEDGRVIPPSSIPLGSPGVGDFEHYAVLLRHSAIRFPSCHQTGTPYSDTVLASLYSLGVNHAVGCHKLSYAGGDLTL